MKLFSITLLLVCFQVSHAQYDDSGKRGLYFPKSVYSGSKLPEFESSRALLPEPVLTDDPWMTELYYKTWQIGLEHLRNPMPGSPFVSDYIDEAFAPQIFQWDTFFMLMFSRYGYHIFPAIGSLDNFYRMQYENGYICREISETDGRDFVFGGREHTVNPPLFSWIEWQYYLLSGDDSRFASILTPLEKYAGWLEQYRKKSGTVHGLYWQTGLGSGMDNTPRSGSGWTDMSAQMVMMYDHLALICETMGERGKAGLYARKARETGELINRYMWNEEDGLYYDVDDEGNQIKCKTIACFWPMLAGLADESKASAMIGNLKDPRTFWRPTPFPSLAADHRMYKADGEYWLGSVWAPTNVMVIKGIDRYPGVLGSAEFSSEAVYRYLEVMNNVYRKTGTLWENYAPESSMRGIWSRPGFVGWTGCGPVQLLIENILGFRPDARENKLQWNIQRIDRHGIRNLRFGRVKVTATAEKRSDITKPIEITVESNLPFNLEIISGSKQNIYQIKEGENKLVFEVL
ncbi:MAG: hypothetical protein FD166_995 [Bacteroidetes bacterium]|nr:MAG: hypothetical protein FD166_995 [Bacteroidota bacterium]